MKAYLIIRHTKPVNGEKHVDTTDIFVFQYILLPCQSTYNSAVNINNLEDQRI